MGYPQGNVSSQLVRLLLAPNHVPPAAKISSASLSLPEIRSRRPAPDMAPHPALEPTTA